MIYIQKRRTPDAVKRKADEIRNALHVEQHGICAYCMQKVEAKSEKMKIEHYEALSENKELALDYQNYFGVCYGGEKDAVEKPRILSCDAARKARKLTINPRDKRQMDAIAYQRNGEIFVRRDKGLDSDLIVEMQKDLDEVLFLNGKKDANGKVLYDTATMLIANRRSICDSVSSQFERWDKKNNLTAEFLQKKLSD